MGVANITNIRYSENISWTMLGDEVFIFNEITNEIFLLKGLMRDFWLLLLKYHNINEIISLLVFQNKCDLNSIESNISMKLELYKEKKLIIWDDIQ